MPPLPLWLRSFGHVKTDVYLIKSVCLAGIKYGVYEHYKSI